MADCSDDQKKKKTEENIEYHATLEQQEQEQEQEEIHQKGKQDDDDSKLVEDEDDWEKIDYQSQKTEEDWERISHQNEEIDNDQSEKENDDDVKVEEEEEEEEESEIDDGSEKIGDESEKMDSEEEAKEGEESMRIQCYYGKNRYYWETEWDHWIYRREGWFNRLDFPSFCSYGPISINDPFKWQAVIIGPTDSPYEDGVFFLTIDLPPDYPNSPPTIVFNTKVFHPNIDGDGKIYVSILEEEEWRPIYTIESLLVSIWSLLGDPDPVDPTFESCSLFRYDRESYLRKAREWTRDYAMPSTPPSYNI